MGKIQLDLDDQLLQLVKELAVQKQMSVEQFIIQTIQNEISADEQLQYLRQRAARGDRDTALTILAKAPDVEPDNPEDRLSSDP